MGHSKTPTFVCEVRLRVTPADERTLLVRLDCARQVYNACLGESLKRLNLMRLSTDFRTASQLPKKSRQRNAAFWAVSQRYGFQEFDLHAYAKQFGHSWLGEHLDSNTVQKLATRAFLATQQYAFGKRGRPRFKGKGWYDCVEGKSNASGILWRERTVRWLGLELPAIVDEHDEVIAHGLNSRVKFVRILRRKLNGRNRFYAQLVCEGHPYRKPKNAIGQGVVGLDIGPSTIAVVSGQSATLERFCDELQPRQRDIRKLNRKLDRQRRANNPQNYNANGTVKDGTQREAWHLSRHYISSRDQLAELHRQQAAYRTSLHGALVNRVLAQGNVIKLEKLSYGAFQRRFGKSVGFRGPGSFVAHLRRQAESAGVQIDEFPTATTRLSQTCLCGAMEKKSLSLRWHECACGVGPVQRDLFSAWLARFVIDERLDAGQARAAWPGEDERLRAASSVTQPAMRQANLPNPARSGQSRSPVKSGAPFDKACRSVPVGTAAGESAVQPDPPGPATA